MTLRRWTWACVGMMLMISLAGADDRTVQRNPDAGGEEAGPRLALIIGNGDYTVGFLKNPPSDARLMADTLRDLGFTVSVHTDLDYAGMNGAIDRFGRSLKDAEIGLFYFAGHGVQFEGSNYLMPVGANIHEGNELRYRAVNAGLVMAKMESAGNPVSLVILDACRNNPYARSWRSAESGLAQMDAPPGTKIIYATRPGDVAKDGDGRNSPFTESLARRIKSADKELEQVIRSVYLDVYKNTGGRQSPWAEGILVKDVYLASSGGQIRRPGPGKLVVEPDVSGAEVWINGKNYEDAREFTISRPGSYRLEVRADGYVTYRTEVSVSPDETVRLPVMLARIDEPDEPAVVPPSPGPPGGKDRFTNSLGMEFVRIPAGSFMMGSPKDEPRRMRDETQHRVTLTRDFFMGTTEVTQGQWKAVMGNNPSHFDKCGEACPVEQVSWNDVQEFIKKLNSLDGRRYRLPTEAEWEYAARAGSTTPFTYGRCLSTDQANYDGDMPLSGCEKGEDRGKTIPVGSLNAPNAFGLHDMHGNVWEWCEDWIWKYPSGSVTDPAGPSTGKQKVARGGDWDHPDDHCRSAMRGFFPADYDLDGVGFRLVSPPGQ